MNDERQSPATARPEVVRVFAATTRAGASQDFADYLLEIGIPELRERRGLRTLDVLSNTEDGRGRFLVTTAWDDLAALTEFAGDPSRPVLSAPERRMLESASVEHFTRLRMGAESGEPHVTVDDASRTVTFGEITIDLPPLEYKLFRSLYDRPHQPVSTTELVSVLWPGSVFARSNDVRRLVFRLRRLLSQAGGHGLSIRTRTGVGYLLDRP